MLSVRSSNDRAKTKSRGHSGFQSWPQVLGYSSLCSLPLKLEACNHFHQYSMAKGMLCGLQDWVIMAHLFLESWTAMLDELHVGSPDERELSPDFLPLQPKWQACEWKSFQISSTRSHSNHPTSNKSSQLRSQIWNRENPCRLCQF